MNLVAPANGELLIAIGEVIRPGKTLIVTKVDVTSVKDARPTLCATLLQALICRLPKSSE
jgi:acyl-coenzyme A thioesterase PaaI-like protein